MTQTEIQNLDVLARLYDTIASRKGADPTSSYTASLFAEGPAHCARKFGEEAVETIIAGAGTNKQDLINESADALYHLLVLLAAHDVSLSDVCATLEKREGTSGHDEKAGRK